MVGLKGNIKATIDIYIYISVYVCVCIRCVCGVRACVRARARVCVLSLRKKIISQEQNKHFRVLLLFLCYKIHMPHERA
jgi:hypothetical protein